MEAVAESGRRHNSWMPQLRARAAKLPWPAIPAALFLLAFLVLPVAMLALTSFWKSAFFTTTVDWNLDQYRSVLDQESVPRTLIRSIYTGVIAATVATIWAIPIAFFLRFNAGRLRAVVLAIVVTALFSSYLVRIYAWRSLMGREGAINWVLQTSGITDQPLLAFFYNRFAVILTLVHIFLPFAIVTLFSAFSAVERDHLEAASTLGARWWDRMRLVVLPLIAPGIFASFAFTFILSAGDYVTPQLVGGTSGSMIGQMISIQFLQNGDYSRGAALSMIFMLSVALTLLVVFLLGKLVMRVKR